VLAALVIAACSDDGGEATVTTLGQRPRIVVGYSDHRESRLVTELYAQSLEQAGFRVARKDTVLTTEQGKAALASGEIQLFVDYSNALLISYDPDATPIAATTTTTSTTTTVPVDATSTTVDTSTTLFDPATATTGSTTTSTTTPLQGALPETLTTGAQSVLNVVPVIACATPETTEDDPTSSSTTSTAAPETTVASSTAESTTTTTAAPSVEDATSYLTLTALSAISADLTLAAPTGWDAGDGAVLADDYSLAFDDVITVTDGAIGEAIANGDADCGVFSSIDPAIVVNSLLVAADDRGALTPQFVVPVLADAAATPEVLSIIDPISQAISPELIRELLKSIEIDGVTTEVLVNDLLAAQGG
jgi:glycine betaine/choline ABC-type transport system substrate-binding protein